MEHPLSTAFSIMAIGLSVGSGDVAAGKRYDRPIYIDGQSKVTSWQKVENGQIPTNAFIAANNAKGAVYVCQTQANGAVVPGQVVDKQCLITFKGKPMKVDNYQVLTANSKLDWFSARELYRYYSRNSMGVIAENSLMPTDMKVKIKSLPIIGGFEFKSRYYAQSTFICRTMAGQEIQLGKMVGNKCHVATDDKEEKSDMFQILAIKN